MALPGFDGRAVLSAYLNGVELRERQRQADIDEALRRNQMQQQAQQFGETMALDQAELEAQKAHYGAVEKLQGEQVQIARDTYSQEYLDENGIPVAAFKGLTPSYSDLQAKYPGGRISLRDARELPIQEYVTSEYYRALTAMKNLTNRPGLISMLPGVTPSGSLKPTGLVLPEIQATTESNEPGVFGTAMDFFTRTGDFASKESMGQKYGELGKVLGEVQQFIPSLPKALGEAINFEPAQEPVPAQMAYQTQYSPEEYSRIRGGIHTLLQAIQDPTRAAELAYTQNLLGDKERILALDRLAQQYPDLGNDPEYQTLLAVMLDMNRQSRLPMEKEAMKIVGGQNKVALNTMMDIIKKQVEIGELTVADGEKMIQEMLEKYSMGAMETAP